MTGNIFRRLTRNGHYAEPFFRRHGGLVPAGPTVKGKFDLIGTRSSC
jgi:hypothetical protein